MRFLGICLLGCAFFCASARAVVIVNQTTSTTIFHEDFESGTFTPSVGSETAGPDVNITTSTTAPDPGPFSGTHYASLFRNSDQPNQGNLLVDPSVGQTTPGDVISIRMMVYLPPDDGVHDAQLQFILDSGNFATARAWAIPSGTGHVLAGTSGGFVDTGLTYATQVWQEWDLSYTITSSTFSVSVNGSTASGFVSFGGPGSVTHADIFNGVRDPAATIYIDDVPEPASVSLAVLGVVALAKRRRAVDAGSRVRQGTKSQTGRIARFVGFALIAMAALGVVSTASATVLLTSYPQGSNGAYSLNGSPPINVAVGFTMGATQSDLTSATVQLSAVGAATFSTSTVHADLYGGNATAPSGSALVSLVLPAGTIAGPADDITMTPASSFTLQASTSYWVVLHPDASVGGNLGVNVAANPATGAFATAAGQTQDGNLPPVTRQNTNVIFQIDGTVPEPAGAMCVIVLAVAFSRRMVGRIDAHRRN